MNLPQVADAPGERHTALDDPPKPVGRLVPLLARPFPSAAGRGGIGFATDPERPLPRRIAEMHHADDVERLRLADLLPQIPSNRNLHVKLPFFSNSAFPRGAVTGPSLLPHETERGEPHHPKQPGTGQYDGFLYTDLG